MHGEDERRARSLEEEVRRRCVSASSRAFNENVFDARETALDRILQAARTLPMFGARRLVVVTSATSLSRSEWEKALPYLRDPCPTTCLIFRGEGKPMASPEVVAAIRRQGVLIEFRARSDRQAETWVVERVRGQGKRISVDAARAIVERVGNLEGGLEGEVQKLIAYVGERGEVSEEDVQEVAADVRMRKVFELGDALGERRPAELLKILHRLLEDGAAPLALLGMLARQIRLLWHAGFAASQGAEAPSPLPQGYSVPPFVRERLMRQSKGWDEQGLRAALGDLRKIDRSLKSGRLDPESLLNRWVLGRTLGKPEKERGRLPARQSSGVPRGSGR
jgi:DNA polymerase-3 subunit delta